MNRKDLIGELAQKFPDFRKKDLELILDLLFQRLARALKDGQRIEIRGFGRFFVREQKERRFKNPRTGEERRLPPRKRIIFKPGKDLKERLNQPALASIDLGTQTFRLLIAKPCHPGNNPAEDHSINNFRILLRKRFNVRLGEGLKKGSISETAFKRGLEALEKIKELLSSSGAEKVLAAGTAVFREAQNARDFILRAQEGGLQIKILSPEEEAHFTLKGVLAGLEENPEVPILVVDAGGGSTEFILGKGEKILKWGSLKLGAVVLTEKYLKDQEIPSEESLKALEAEIERELNPLEELPLSPQKLIATGGTASCLASLKLGLEKYCPERIHGLSISLAELERTYKKLCQMPVEERRCLKGLEPGREDIILAGLMIYLGFLRHLPELKNIIVSETGILEGLLLHLWQENPIISAKN